MSPEDVLQQKQAAVASVPVEALVKEVFSDVSPYLLKLMQRPLNQAIRRVQSVYPALHPSRSEDPYMGLASAAVDSITLVENRILAIRNHLVMQEASVKYALTRDARDRLILETAHFLGATPQQLRQDRKALRRWFDWAAVCERADHHINFQQRVVQACVMIAGAALRRQTNDQTLQRMEQTGFVRAAREALSHPMNPVFEREWVNAMLGLLNALSKNGMPCTLPAPLLDALIARAKNSFADLWVQCSAAHAWLLCAPEDATAQFVQRLSNPKNEKPDNLFFRRHVLDELLSILPEKTSLDLIRIVLTGTEPSAHVRQGAILALGEFNSDAAQKLFLDVLPSFLEKERVSQVRAVVPITLGQWLRKRRGLALVMKLWQRFFRTETDAFAIRVGIRHLGDAFEKLIPLGQMSPANAEVLALEIVSQGSEMSWSIPTRRQAEELLERIRVASFPEFSAFRKEVATQLSNLDPGTEIDLAIQEGDVDPNRLGRFLAWLSRQNHGFYARVGPRGWRVLVGHRIVFRWWRFFFETLQPAPDKRQGFSHVTGRLAIGNLRAHSVLMGEESPTKVPGEPVKIYTEGGWRRFLPPLDDFLDSLSQGEIRVFSSEGMVTIDPPEEAKRRRRLWWKLTWKYGELAALREQSWVGNPEVKPSAYINRMRELGFKVQWKGYVPSGWSTADDYFTPPEEKAEESKP